MYKEREYFIYREKLFIFNKIFIYMAYIRKRVNFNSMQIENIGFNIAHCIVFKVNKSS